MTPDTRAPDPAVVRAFRAVEPVGRLAGGRGRTYRAGHVVLRPHDGAAETDWRADVLAALQHHDDFRTPRPVATADGGWRSGDWEAWEWVPGHADERRVEDVLRAGAAFHRAVAHLGRPGFLDRKDDAWSRADRAAWGEAALPPGRTLARLAGAFLPVSAPEQLVHGDLLGNVLFSGPGVAPVVIDWAPYWRAPGHAAAIAVTDAVCWHGLPVDRVDALGVGTADWRQLLVRALAFRIATLHLLGAWDDAAVRRHRSVVDALT